MAPIWAFLFVIFAIPGIGQSVKPLCPNNKTFRCVQAPNCTQHIGDFRCSSTSEVCCEQKNVNSVVRITGQPVKQLCPNNKTHRCVPAFSCSQNLGSYRCSSTTEVCCEEKKVNTVVRNTGQPVKQLCPNDKIHRCVPASSCSQNVRIITAYRCSSTNEVCCEGQRVNTVVRITGQPVKQLCPNNKIHQCVPAPYCPRDVGSIATYRCSSTTEVCCEEKRILFGQRYIGAGKYVPGPYAQDL